MADTRVFYGANCIWFGPVTSTSSTPARPSPFTGKMMSGLPCCPHCGSVGFETESWDTWWSQVDAYEADGHPGYRAMIEWSVADGRHFMSIEDLTRTYHSVTGTWVPL